MSEAKVNPVFSDYYSKALLCRFEEAVAVDALRSSRRALSVWTDKDEDRRTRIQGMKEELFRRLSPHPEELR